MLTIFNFKTFQVYSSCYTLASVLQMLPDFKTFQVYSSYMEMTRLNTMPIEFQNFSSLQFIS